MPTLRVTCDSAKVIGRLCLIVFLLSAILLLFGRGASANTIEQATNAYVDGQFMSAAQIAESIGSSPGYALAAKSLTIHARYFADESEKKIMLERAIELAHLAIESNPNNAEAYLQLARAMGRHARQISKLQKTKEKYAARTRKAIENALQINPDLAAAHVSMGRWHVGIVARAGALLARTVFGARKKDAIFHFEQAINLSQQSKRNNLEIAIGYLILDDKKYKAEAYSLLKEAIELPTNDAYEAIIHASVHKQLQALESSDS